jgi:hypothetical protein
MCSVSAVSDYYQNTYQNRINPFQHGMTVPGLGTGGYQPPVVHTFDAETKEMMRQALILLDKIDKKLGDVECMDDAKAAFLKTLNLNPSDISGG